MAKNKYVLCGNEVEQKLAKMWIKMCKFASKNGYEYMSSFMIVKNGEVHIDMTLQQELFSDDGYKHPLCNTTTL